MPNNIPSAPVRKERNMLEKAQHICELISQMDAGGVYFSNATKQHLEEVYVEIMWEARFPPQMYPEVP